jgi:hypothetical protein
MAFLRRPVKTGFKVIFLIFLGLDEKDLRRIGKATMGNPAARLMVAHTLLGRFPVSRFFLPYFFRVVKSGIGNPMNCQII